LLRRNESANCVAGWNECSGSECTDSIRCVLDVGISKRFGCNRKYSREKRFALVNIASFWSQARASMALSTFLNSRFRQGDGGDAIVHASVDARFGAPRDARDTRHVVCTRDAALSLCHSSAEADQDTFWFDSKFGD
jgi:hypothetical protein